MMNDSPAVPDTWYARAVRPLVADLRALRRPAVPNPEAERVRRERAAIDAFVRRECDRLDALRRIARAHAADCPMARLILAERWDDIERVFGQLLDAEMDGEMEEDANS